MKPSYKVDITPADNGIVVRVGCKFLVFEDNNYTRFFELLKRYLAGEEDALQAELFSDPIGKITQPRPNCETGSDDF